MAVNLELLEQFELFLREENFTIEDSLRDLTGTTIIIHYKKLISIVKNYSKSQPKSSKFINSLVGFLIEITSYDIHLDIILDGIKPKILTEN